MEAWFLENKLFAWALSSIRVAAVGSDVTVCSDMAREVQQSNWTDVDAAAMAMMCVWVPSVWSLQE